MTREPDGLPRSKLVSPFGDLSSRGIMHSRRRRRGATSRERRNEETLARGHRPKTREARRDIAE